MHTSTRTLTIERMLESADPHIAQHRVNPAMPDSINRTPQLPQGWILHSASYTYEGSRKGWDVQILDTTKPYGKDSILTAWHSGSLDAALRAASRSIPGPVRIPAHGLSAHF